MSTINITGIIAGIGNPSYFINSSKNNTINPTLNIQFVGYSKKDCPIAAIEYEGFSPNKIIEITDLSSNIYENTDAFYVVEDISLTGSLYTINHYPYSDVSSGLLNYLVTDIRSDNQNGRPLFYQYELLYDAKSASNDNFVHAIYKNNEVLIDKTSYIVQISNDLISTGHDRYSSTSWETIRSDFNTIYTKRIRVLLPIEFSDVNTFYTVEYEKVVNGISTNQKELLELNPLYIQDRDYKVYESGLYVIPTGYIRASQSLMVVKDPQYRIYPLDIAVIKNQASYATYVSDIVSSWNLRVNIGSFLHPASIYNNESSGNFYYLPNTNLSGRMVVSNIKPELIGTDVLKVNICPIYISAYSYPDYNVPIYDDAWAHLTDLDGKVAIYINGRNRTDIKILSVDRKKGYFYLNKDLSPTDEIELSFYIENDSSLVIENLELNPRVNNSGTTLYHISGYPNGIGIAMRPYNGAVETTYPYIYDPSIVQSSRIYKSIPPIGGGSGVELSYSSHFSVCELFLNRLTKDSVKVTDSRKIGGGFIEKDINKWYTLNYGNSSKAFEYHSYADVGYYDGEPLAHNGMIIIHIPQSLIDEHKQKWIDHYIPMYDEYNDAVKKGESEFKYYLNQVIKRYISGGSDYVLIPTVSGSVTDILYLE